MASSKLTNVITKETSIIFRERDLGTVLINTSSETTCRIVHHQGQALCKNNNKYGRLKVSFQFKLKIQHTLMNTTQYQLPQRFTHISAFELVTHSYYICIQVLRNPGWRDRRRDIKKRFGIHESQPTVHATLTFPADFIKIYERHFVHK